MGSLANIKKSIARTAKSRMQQRYKLSEEMVYKLFKARDAAFFKALDRLGVSDKGLRDEKDNINQTALARRMQLAGVTIRIVDHHERPQDNGIVFFKNGRPEVAISQPFIDKGNIVVQFVSPSMLISGAA